MLPRGNHHKSNFIEHFKPLCFAAFYLIWSQSTAILCLLSTILVMNVYHKGNRRPVPPAMRAVVTRLGHVVCRPLQGKEAERHVTPVRPAEEPDNEKPREAWTPPHTEREAPGGEEEEQTAEGEAVKREWKEMAKILDKFLFYVFFTLMAVSNIGVVVTIMTRNDEI